MNHVSRTKLLSLLPVLILLYLISRLLLPYGDEPDWLVRKFELLALSDSFWTPYYFFSSLMHHAAVNPSDCLIEASATSLGGHFSSGCFTRFYDNVNRFLITFILMFPIIAVLFFKNYSGSFKKFELTYCNPNLRLAALCMSLFFPGVIYYLGVFSPEQLSLVICLLLIVFYDRIVIVLLLFALAALVDFGNALVFMLFFLYFRSSLSVANRFGLKMFFIASVLLMLAALVAGYVVLSVFESYGPYLGSIMAPVLGKASAIFEALEQGGYAEKYPVFLRPLITYMSSIFLLPSGFKATIAIIFTTLCLMVFSLLFVVNKTYKKREVLPEVYLFLLCPVFFVCMMTFLIPNYAFAKYYIFTMPFVLYGFLNFVSFNRCFVVILLINFFIIAELLYSGI